MNQSGNRLWISAAKRDPTRPDPNPRRVRDEFWAETGRLRDVIATIDRLRNSWSARDVPGRVAERGLRLQAEEPQLPDICGEFGGEPPARSLSSVPAWVATRSVVSTTDRVWGKFDRLEGERGARWIPDKTRELLAAPDLPKFLSDHFGGGQAMPVQLRMLPGPAGPLHVLGSGGSHRTHLCRILGLPWIFAITTVFSTPRLIENTQGTPAGAGAFETTARLWHGLLAHNVVHGRLATRDRLTTLHIEHTPAPWLVLPARHAVSYNQRYELLYPGALELVGIPRSSFRSPESWTAWLTRRSST